MSEIKISGKAMLVRIERADGSVIFEGPIELNPNTVVYSGEKDLKITTVEIPTALNSADSDTKEQAAEKSKQRLALLQPLIDNKQYDASDKWTLKAGK
jgi:hypothetical protein